MPRSPRFPQFWLVPAWPGRAAAVLCLLLATATVAVRSDETQATLVASSTATDALGSAPQTLAMADAWNNVGAELIELSRLRANVIGPHGSVYGLETFAGEAAIAAFEVRGDPINLTVDLAGNPRMADRVAIGLAELSVGFSRSVEPDDHGFYGTILRIDPEGLTALGAPPSTEGAAARLATMIELDGSVEGRLARRENVAAVEELAKIVGLPAMLVDGELWISGLGAIEVLAELHYVDLANVPFLGSDSTAAVPPPINPGLGSKEVAPEVSLKQAGLGIEPNHWRVGITGKLPAAIDPDWTGLISESESPIGWTNAVAQSYRSENVDFLADRIKIDIRPSTEKPASNRLPFTSGMLVSEDTFGWGTTTVEIDLPDAPGLWPAVWFLDDQACFAPGICPGYNTSNYHEVDIIETRTQQPDIGHVSVHWGQDDRTVSTSATAQISQEADGKLEVQLERRPGLLIWRFDGRVVHMLAGPVDGFETGPHRLGAMRLILNTAVGGSFSGGELIGRDGGWWGDARAPEGFGQLLWTESSFTIYSVTHEPL